MPRVKVKRDKKSNGGVSLVQEAKEGWSYKMPFERDLEEFRESCRWARERIQGQHTARSEALQSICGCLRQSEKASVVRGG